MGRVEEKKKQFKSRVKKGYDDTRPFVWAISLCVVILCVGLFLGLKKNSESNAWDINTLVEGDYVAEVKGEENHRFISVNGELDDIELIRLQLLTSRHLAEEMPLYLMSDNETADNHIPYYEQNLLKRVEWKDGKNELITFTEYPEINSDITALSEWDITSSNTVIQDETLIIDGYVDPNGSSVEVVEQLKGLSDMIDGMNEDEAQEAYQDKLFEFQYGSFTAYYHTAFDNVLGKGETFIINSQN